MFRLARILALTSTASFLAVGAASAQSDENYGYGRTPTAVDLGLSVMWADHNVGADHPSEVGRLFGYGDVEGKETSNDMDKYVSGDISGTERDPAYVYWGGGWRMPTQSELEELQRRCKWKWVKNGKVAGFRVIGTNGRSIFLPVTGMKSNGNLQFADIRGYYWSGEMCGGGSSYVYALFFYNGNQLIKNYKKVYGFAIRPVKED